MDGFVAKIKAFFRDKVFNTFMGFLKAGVTPEKLSLAIAFGIVIGIIPLLGTTTLLCALAAFVFGLNMPVLQLVNYIIFPLQLILFLPFFKLGSLVFNPQALPNSVDQVSLMFKTDWWAAIQALWLANVQAIGVWVIVSVPLFFICYYGSKGILKKVLAASN